MIASLKQRVKGRVGVATAMFACLAVLTIPFLMAATGLKVSSTPTASRSAPGVHNLSLTDLSRINHAIQLQGSLIATSNRLEVTKLTFTIANTTSAKALKLTPDSLRISYRDQNQRINHLAWTAQFLTHHQNNQLLAPGEQVQLTIPLASVLKNHLGPNTSFVIDVTPPQGAILHINRTTPAQLDAVLDLS